MATPDEPQPMTAEDAILDIEMHQLGMIEGNAMGLLAGDEARKLVEYLFADEGGLPEDLKRFFDAPQEE